MKIAFDHLNEMKGEIVVKAFKNDMLVLHTSKSFYININFLEDFSIENINVRLQEHLKEVNHVDINQFSNFIELKNTLLAKIIIEEMIEKGYLCIDEAALELNYYSNLILRSF